MDAPTPPGPTTPVRSEGADLAFNAVKGLVGVSTLLVSLAGLVLFAFLAGASALYDFAIPLATSIALMASSNRIVVALLLVVNVTLLVFFAMMIHGVLNYHGGR